MLYRDGHQPDDPLPGAAGLYRRRHDPDGLRGLLHHLPARKAAHDRPADRARGDAGPDHRPDHRGLSDRPILLALAVSGQCGAGHRCDPGQLVPDRLRQAGILPAGTLRLVRPARHGGVSGRHGIRAGGRSAEELVRRERDHRLRRRVGGRAPSCSSGVPPRPPNRSSISAPSRTRTSPSGRCSRS